MQDKTRKSILNLIIFLSVISLLTSIYLTESHTKPAESGSICDFNEHVSCSIVNTSVFSELLNVPVAIFGFVWCVIMIWFAQKAKNKKKRQIMVPLMTAWSVVGIFSVVYLVIAEILLKALCPACTLVHICVIAILILSISLYKSEKQISKDKLIKAAKPIIVAVIILNLIPLIYFNFPSGNKEDLAPLAQCVTDKGVKMYGSFRCGICAKERALFDDAFQYINEIECHPQGEHAQVALCQEKKIEGTPTWILEDENGVEIKRKIGFMNPNALREFSGCEV